MGHKFFKVCTCVGHMNDIYDLNLTSEKSQRRQWHPTPVPLPGKSHGWRTLVGCSPWGRESDMTERLDFHFSLSCIREGNDNPLQCSCLENPRDGGAWWAAIYGVAQSQAAAAAWEIYGLEGLQSLQAMKPRTKSRFIWFHVPCTFCRGASVRSPPMAKVMRKEAWHTQRHDQASGNPLFPSI